MMLLKFQRKDLAYKSQPVDVGTFICMNREGNLNWSNFFEN